MSTDPSEQEPQPGQDAGPEPERAPGLEAPPAGEAAVRPGDKPDELLVFDHGFVRLDDAMADDLSVVNAARVSFAVRKDAMDDRDRGLIRFLMRNSHGTPFEHNSFRFHIRAPVFVAREWFRHRIGCLTGDAVVTFVNCHGAASSQGRKTMEELWRMWSRGERNGHALSKTIGDSVDALVAGGVSLRGIARQTGVGRRAVTRHVKEGSTTSRDSRWRVRRMRLRVLNEETKQFETGHIDEVFYSGIQPVYRVTLADGKRLTMTENHRVLTPNGWATLAEAVGLQGRGNEARMTRPCFIFVNGQRLYRDREWMTERRARGADVKGMALEAGCSYHTIRAWLRRHGLQFSLAERSFRKGNIPWNQGVRGYHVRRETSDAQREAIRRARSGPRSNFWRGGVSSERASIARWTTEQAPRVHAAFDYVCQACGRRGGRLHAHHIFPVWAKPEWARRTGNLTSVCDGCHRRIHRTLDSEIKFARSFSALVGVGDHLPPSISRRGFKLTAHAIEVTGLEYLGEQPTYDLAVVGPWHNFVANGMVVHNSFNEESARYHKLEGDFYLPAREAVRTQVGKPGSYTFEPAEDALADQTIATLQRVYRQLYGEYKALIDSGVAKELARSVLPFGIYTQFYWTINARSLMNFLSLRNSSDAQYEIRKYAEAVEQLFARKMPVTHECFLEFGRRVP